MDPKLASKAVKRHIVVSAGAALTVLALAVMDGLPPMTVFGIAAAAASVVCLVSMHLFAEQGSIQTLIGLTVFFVIMMAVLFRLGLLDTIEGTVHRGYSGAVETHEEPH